MILHRNQKGFLLSPVYNDLRVIFVVFSKQTYLKTELRNWRNSLDYWQRKNSYKWMKKWWMTFFKLSAMYMKNEDNLSLYFSLTCLKTCSKVWDNLTTESPFKMMKNAFYFILKAFFILKIFTFLSSFFGHAEKTVWFGKKG